MDKILLRKNSDSRKSDNGKKLPEPDSGPSSPLILEDMSMFYFRQLVTSLKDNDLQQKIDHEIKMREGTARLLVASKHPAQVLEAAKNLLSSNTRIIAYMTELQRRKTAEVLGKQSSVEGNQLPCSAQLSVSDIRIPLMWRDADHFRNKGDYRRYAVFCLLKVGTEIYDTSMISDVDRSMTDITFEDVIHFDDVPHDFEMKLEVYCHKLHEEFSVASTPKKLRKKINDISGSVGRSVGKRLSGLNDADVIGNMVLGPKFELVAKGSLHLSDVDNSVRTYDLQLETNAEGQVHELPLFGHYCCRLAALPHCLVQPTVTGFLNLQEDDDLSKWKRYWCSLKNLQLSCWSSPDDVEVIQPLLSIPVTKSTQISDADPTTSQKSHSFLIKTVNINGIFCHTLAADTKEELNKWWDGFQQHLLDQALWKHACDEVMDLKSATRRKLPAFVRKSSLYEDTPLIEPENNGDSLVSDLGNDQLTQMLHTLMGEASQIRGGTSSQS
ncbi:rhotekin-like isoform X3 [Biomphalaria glabrata]|uniref:Rhotekin-like isoform X3 n=1 Tax=Biomphalaria glabrata TaxID=6526 RepID=A0A9W2ZKE5_BIOGL|nr:rhotekin-like isoform X3 [Biomphalaria glabrata]XP_055875375.1 rhotekin-like isoform X3 [Biomphalaria glabrata]XP_055875383.1 rhotekin-like isoform X3 [Biomphalaria glabrata]